MSDTINCPECDVTIGKDEKECPSCHVNIEELEEAISTVERANKVIEKRKRASVPPPPETPEPEAPKKKSSIFTRFGKRVTKKG